MRLRYALTIVALLAMPAAVLAQDGRSASVAGAVSATLVEDGTEASFSGAFGYRFSRVVGFEIEATVVPTLKSPYPDDPYVILANRLLPAIFPQPRFENPGGRMVILSNNVRIAVPTPSSRLEPYFVTGGGIASVRRTADYVFAYGYPIDVLAVPGVVPPGLTPPIPVASLVPPRGEYREKLTGSALEMALTLGGGVSVRITRELAVEADLRAIRLLGEEDRSVGRFGVGVRYRF